MDFQAYNKILICKSNMKNVAVGDVVIGYRSNIRPTAERS